MLVPKDDIIRHKILGILIERLTKDKNIYKADIKIIRISIPEVAGTFNTTVHHIKLLTSVLYADNEIRFSDEDNVQYMHAGSATVKGFTTKKYIKQGRKETIDLIKSYLNISVSVIAIITAVISLISAFVSISDNHTEIKKIKERLDLIEQRSKVETLPKIHPGSPFAKK